jgi:hypothetical protein
MDHTLLILLLPSPHQWPGSYAWTVSKLTVLSPHPASAPAACLPTMSNNKKTALNLLLQQTKGNDFRKNL